MLIKLIKSFNYTRQVYKISRELGNDSEFSLSNNHTDKAIKNMNKLWETNNLLSPIVKKYKISSKELEDYYWQLTANGAAQWVGGYFVPVASLCFPFPLEYVLNNKEEKSVSEMAFKLLEYFEKGNPYLPIL